MTSSPSDTAVLDTNRKSIAADDDDNNRSSCSSSSSSSSRNSTDGDQAPSSLLQQQQQVGQQQKMIGWSSWRKQKQEEIKLRQHQQEAATSSKLQSDWIHNDSDNSYKIKYVKSGFANSSSSTSSNADAITDTDTDAVYYQYNDLCRLSQETHHLLIEEVRSNRTYDMYRDSRFGYTDDAATSDTLIMSTTQYVKTERKPFDWRGWNKDLKIIEEESRKAVAKQLEIDTRISNKVQRQILKEEQQQQTCIQQSPYDFKPPPYAAITRDDDVPAIVSPAIIPDTLVFNEELESRIRRSKIKAAATATAPPLRGIASDMMAVCSKDNNSMNSVYIHFNLLQQCKQLQRHIAVGTTSATAVVGDNSSSGTSSIEVVDTGSSDCRITAGVTATATDTCAIGTADVIDTAAAAAAAIIYIDSISSTSCSDGIDASTEAVVAVATVACAATTTATTTAADTIDGISSSSSNGTNASNAEFEVAADVIVSAPSVVPTIAHTTVTTTATAATTSKGVTRAKPNAQHRKSVSRTHHKMLTPISTTHTREVRKGKQQPLGYGTVFGIGCDRQEHLLYGQCIDGMCGRRGTSEKLAHGIKDYHRLSGTVETPTAPLSHIDAYALSLINNPKNDNSYIPTAIYLAVASNDVEAIRNLSYINQEINDILDDRKKHTVLHIGVLRRCTDAIHTLLHTFNSHVNIDCVDVNGNTPLHLAVLTNQEDMVYHLCNEKFKSRAGKIRNNKNQLPTDICKSQEIYQCIQNSIILIELNEELLHIRHQISSHVMTDTPVDSTTTTLNAIAVHSNPDCSNDDSTGEIRKKKTNGTPVVSTAAIPGTSLVQSRSKFFENERNIERQLSLCIKRGSVKLTELSNSGKHTYHIGFLPDLVLTHVE